LILVEMTIIVYKNSNSFAPMMTDISTIQLS
jgi:hypothetical protein